MKNDWKPISEQAFRELLADEVGQLASYRLRIFTDNEVPFGTTAVIHRSDMYGDERVYVVAKMGSFVLYYDDVEGGFDISPISADNRILERGGSQASLGDALVDWLPRNEISPG